MAVVSSTRKSFNFRVEMLGLDPFLVQKVTLPTIEIEKVEHSEGNIKIKTPGKITVGDCVLEKLKPGDAVDPWAFQRLLQAQSQITGGGVADPKQVANIYELGSDGQTPVGVWVLEGVWVCKIENGDFDKNASDHMIEKVTLSVDRCYKVNT